VEKASKDKKRLPDEDSANERFPRGGRRNLKSTEKNQRKDDHMATEKKSAAPKAAAKAKAQIKVKDLKTRKDPRGGRKNGSDDF